MYPNVHCIHLLWKCNSLMIIHNNHICKGVLFTFKFEKSFQSNSYFIHKVSYQIQVLEKSISLMVISSILIDTSPLNKHE